MPRASESRQLWNQVLPGESRERCPSRAAVVASGIQRWPQFIIHFQRGQSAAVQGLVVLSCIVRGGALRHSVEKPIFRDLFFEFS